MGYSPTIGRWIERDPKEYVDGPNQYQAYSSNPANMLDPMGTEAAATQPSTKPSTQPTAEEQLWEKQQKAAQKALDFWNKFLNLRMGKDAGGGPMSDECKDKFMCLIRAMSWVESRHGSGAGNHPDRDPMQSGNPNDLWWQGIQGITAPDRIVGGPGKGNWNSNQMPGATGIPAPKKGHQDPSFTPEMSYLWGVLGLIHKTNLGPKGGGKTYRCGDCSWDQLLDGAQAYNGGGDAGYRQKVKDAIKMAGCMK